MRTAPSGSPGSWWANAWRLARDNPFWLQLWVGAVLVSPAAAVGGVSSFARTGRIGYLALAVAGAAATVGVWVWTYLRVRGFSGTGRHAAYPSRRR